MPHIRTEAHSWGGISEKYFGWLTWTNAFIITALMCVVMESCSALAETNAQMVTVAPANEGVNYYRVQIFYPGPEDKVLKKRFDEILADFRKVGMLVVPSQPTQVEVCQMWVVIGGYYIKCKTASQNSICILGPEVAKRQFALDFLASYYRGCGIRYTVTPRVWT